MSNEPGTPRQSLYFSHSWKPDDVDINLTIWDAICERCALLVDPNPDPNNKPPWYVNRLEEYIRRSDLFLAALPFRDREVKEVGFPDEKVRCSTWSVFEVRLAERARKPRFVVYDRRTRFVPGTAKSKTVRYLQYALDDLHAKRATYIREELTEWLDEVDKILPAPRTSQPSSKATLLIPEAPDRDKIVAAVTNGLEKANFFEVVAIASADTDVEVLNHLHDSALLVAEMGSGPLWDTYGMAHALFLPTVRLMRGGGDATEVPMILRGHPAGYQKDLVRWTTYEQLEKAVADHAKEMRDPREPIDSCAEGRAYFQRPLSEGELHHRVFISHNLKDRELIKAVKGRLDGEGIKVWEYGEENEAGEDWRDELKRALAEATHVVAILADDYELSDACNLELDVLLERQVVWLPFLYGGRKRHNPRIGKLGLHHESLASDPQQAAEQVLRAVKSGLTRS